MTTRTRQEHLAWARERALAHLEEGDLKSAVASMDRDLGEYPGLQMSVAQLRQGMFRIIERDVAGVRRWIEAFDDDG